MRLLTYTKYLWRKVKFYDKLAFKTNSFLQNPFDDKEKSITVLWIEDEDKNIFYCPRMFRDKAHERNI